MKTYVFSRDEMMKVFNNIKVLESIYLEDEHELFDYKNSLNIVKSILDNDREFWKEDEID